VDHELTHAFLSLEDPEYGRMASEMQTEMAEFVLSRRQSGNSALHGDMARERLIRLQSMSDKLEGPAEAAELEIWLERLNGRCR